jgi:hypothetical protein
MLKIME